MNPWKFQIGEKVNITYGKYRGCNAIVTQWHPIQTRNLYTVQEIQSGTLVALLEDELQSMFEHDMGQLKLWGGKG
jgi:hypothetical protein